MRYGRSEGMPIAPSCLRSRRGPQHRVVFVSVQLLGGNAQLPVPLQTRITARSAGRWLGWKRPRCDVRVSARPVQQGPRGLHFTLSQKDPVDPVNQPAPQREHADRIDIVSTLPNNRHYSNRWSTSFSTNHFSLGHLGTARRKTVRRRGLKHGRPMLDTFPVLAEASF